MMVRWYIVLILTLLSISNGTTQTSVVPFLLDSTQTKERNIQLQVNAGLMLVWFSAHKYQSFVANPYCKESHFISPLPFLNIYGNYKRFGLKFEQATAVPQFGLSYRLHKEEEKRNLYAEINFTVASNFYKNFWNSKVGRGLGLRYSLPNWTYGLSYTIYKTPFEYCNGFHSNLTSYQIRANFSRRIFKPKRTYD